MRYFYMEPEALKKSPARLEGSEARHIKNVLRLKPGSKICLLDGKGFEYEAIIRQFLAGGVELEIIEKRSGKKESPVHIGVAQAFLKDKKMERLLRHLCELGISHWTPFICERSIPAPGKKRLSTRMQRWQKIVQESLKQCHRVKLPRIAEPKTFENILEDGQGYDIKILFYENENTTLNSLMTSSLPSRPQNILLILGPEGGFVEAEIEKARAAGCLIVGLGPRILRAETACIAACALAQFLFGDMG